MSLVGPRPERPEFVAVADRADSVLRPAPRRQARADRLGAGALHLRRQRRGRAGEAAVRPVLHQEHVDRARPVHHLRDDQDRAPAAGRVHDVGEPRRDAAGRQRDDDRRRGLLPRQRLRRRRAARTGGTRWRAASCANTERLLAIFDEHGVAATFFVLGWVARAVSRAGAARSPPQATRSRRTATRTGWSTTRRRRRSATTSGARRTLLEDGGGAAGASATARRATRSRRGRCGRSTC